MLLNFNFHENLINSETSQHSARVSTKGKTREKGDSEVNFQLISEKIKIPEIKENLTRKRLISLLETFSKRFCATLIDGRAGTGKTTLACDFAKSFQKVVWFTVGSTDADWRIFSRYFLASMHKIYPEINDQKVIKYIDDPKKQNVQKFVETVFFDLEKLNLDNSMLFVIDEIHNVFDTNWFEAFFKEMLAYNFPNIAILLLSRTQPPFPIWRLRSKQKLGYLDEKLLLFTMNELQEIIDDKNLGRIEAEKIYRRSFGRISKVIEIADLKDKTDS